MGPRSRRQLMRGTTVPDSPRGAAAAQCDVRRKGTHALPRSRERRGAPLRRAEGGEKPSVKGTGGRPRGGCLISRSLPRGGSILTRLHEDGSLGPGAERPPPLCQAAAAHRHLRPHQLQPRRHLPPEPAALRPPLPRPPRQARRLHCPPALQGAQADPHATPGQQHPARGPAQGPAAEAVPQQAEGRDGGDV